MRVLKSQSMKPGTTSILRLLPPKETDWLLVTPLSAEVPELTPVLLGLLLLPGALPIW